MTAAPDLNDRETALAQGRKEGLATAALALACLSFVNLLGAEKGLMALVLGIVALSGPPLARSRARIAIGLAVLQIATVLLVLTIFHAEIAQLVTLLAKLG